MNRDPLEERIVSREIVHTGKMITTEHLTVELPNGRTSTRDVVRHPGAVAVLAEVDGTLLCVEQFRIAPGQVLLEIPAGKLDPGEEPLACAKRELKEETGYIAGSWTEIGHVFTSPGFADEQIYIFEASDLSAGERALDEDEFLNVRHLTFDEVRNLVETRQIHDAKTLIAFQWWLLHANGTERR